MSSSTPRYNTGQHIVSAGPVTLHRAGMAERGNEQGSDSLANENWGTLALRKQHQRATAALRGNRDIGQSS